jgi:hypothetical protein
MQVALGVDHGHSCAVVAAIFKTMKAFYQYGVSFLLTDISYYSAHNIVLIVLIVLDCKNTNFLQTDKKNVLRGKKNESLPAVGEAFCIAICPYFSS